MLCKTDESWLQRGSEVVSAQDHEVKSIWKKKNIKEHLLWVSLREACFTDH